MGLPTWFCDTTLARAFLILPGTRDASYSVPFLFYIPPFVILILTFVLPFSSLHSSVALPRFAMAAPLTNADSSITVVQNILTGIFNIPDIKDPPTIVNTEAIRESLEQMSPDFIYFEEVGDRHASRPPLIMVSLYTLYTDACLNLPLFPFLTEVVRFCGVTFS